MRVAQALLYLRVTQAGNRLRGLLRNLRKPGYFLGLALLLVIVALMLSGRSRTIRPPTSEMMGFLELAAGGMVTLMFYLGWLLPDNNPTLTFTEAETAFLFPAPASRRQLVHYKLISSLGLALMVSLLPVVFLTLPNPLAGAADFLRLWLVLSCINLINFYQSAAASLLKLRAVSGSRAGWFRVAVIAVGLVLLAVAIVFKSAGQLDVFFRWQPGRLLVHAAFANGMDYTIAQYLLLMAVALNYWWILRLDLPFEEHALALAARRTALVAGKAPVLQRNPAGSEPFPLREGSPFELVLLWKNLLTIPAYLNRRVWCIALAVTVLLMELLPRTGGEAGLQIARTLGGAAMVSLTMLCGLAPTLSGVGIGTELTRADLLKAWPVPGWRIVLGSMLMPLVVMTAMVWLLLLAIALSPQPPRVNAVAEVLGSRSQVLLIASLVLPAIQSLQLVLGFIPPLVFPDLLKPGVATRGGGLDLLGTGMLMTVGVSLLMVVGLVPPTLVALLIFYFGQWFSANQIVLLLSAGAAIVVLLLEMLFVVHLLGERFEKLDIANDLRM